jgi:ABC-2 type transport system permease protein
VAYFLWSSIFEGLGVDSIQGFKLTGLVFYYLLVTTLERVHQGAGWKYGTSEEIYSGALSRYLVYPVGFFAFKAASQYAHALVNWLKTFVAIGVFVWVFGLPEGVNLSWASLVQGLILSFLAVGLHMCMALFVDTGAFWADNVWSLHIMVRFLTQLLGAAMVPLAFFSLEIQNIFLKLPFVCLVHFPIQALLGNLSWAQFFSAAIQTVIWILGFRILFELTWVRGLKRYTGVGM